MFQREHGHGAMALGFFAEPSDLALFVIGRAGRRGHWLDAMKVSLFYGTGLVVVEADGTRQGVGFTR